MKRIKKFISTSIESDLVLDLKNKSTHALSRAKAHGEKAWIGGVAVVGDVSQFISETEFVSKLNTYSSEVSKAMDSGFKTGSIDLETSLKMMPNNHRILDGGHGFFESIQKAREVGDAKDWSDSEVFVTWFKSYFTDLSSPAGMPVFGKVTDEAYSLLRDLGMSEENARDLLTLNGQEAIEALLGGTLSAVALFMAWNKKDKENFSKTIGSIGLGSMIGMNPVLLVVILVAAAVGYNTLVCHKAVARGAIVSATMMLTSALVPGPLILGVVPGIVMAVYVSKKMGKEFDLAAHIKIIYAKVQDPIERQKIISSVESLMQTLMVKEAPEKRPQTAG